MKCPHCHHEFRLTWKRYLWTRAGHHECPQCHQLSRFRFTYLYFLALFPAFGLGGFPAGFLFLILFGQNIGFIGFLLGGLLTVLPIDKFIDDRFRPLEKITPRNIRRMLSDFSFKTLILLACIWVFYTEENWRGGWEWADAQKSLKAAGDDLDFNHYIPPPVPDEQNLASLPLFQLEPDPHNRNTWQPVVLRNALENLSKDFGPLPKTGSWAKGELSDKDLLGKWISERYKKIFPGKPPNPDWLQELDALCPALSELRVAAATRPFCRFKRDYTSVPPYMRTDAILIELMPLVKDIQLHAIAALNTNKPEIALKDIELALKINAGLRQEPNLMPGLMANSFDRIEAGIIWEGLSRHAWSDDQLIELQKKLREVDLLADFQLCMRGEALGIFVPSVDYFRDRKNSLRVNLWVIPRGWFDRVKAGGVSFRMLAARELASPTLHRIYPTKANEFKQKMSQLNRFSLSSLLLRFYLGNVRENAASFSEGQSRIDEAVIACSLERYRLVHGSYPGSLDDLASYSPTPLPHDIINGEPYHYRLLPDGKFSLYSVGWNQVDDGGQTSAFPSVDQNLGDWVWPMVKSPVQTPSSAPDIDKTKAHH